MPPALSCYALSCRNIATLAHTTQDVVRSPLTFFQTKKYALHSPRSRQNAVTVCPLRACSEISSRHFVQVFFVRRFMAQHCYTLATPRKMWFVNRSRNFLG